MVASIRRCRPVLIREVVARLPGSPELDVTPFDFAQGMLSRSHGSSARGLLSSVRRSVHLVMTVGVQPALVVSGHLDFPVE